MSTRKTKIRKNIKFTRKHLIGGNSKSGGVFCYMPYSSLDMHDKSTFKIESSINIKEQFKKMTKFFPTGFYVIAILKKPTVGNKKIKNRKIYYELIKDKIIELIGGGISEQSDDGGWVYCTIDNIHDGFKKAEEMYGGEREEFGLTGRIKDSMKLVDIQNTKKPIYVGKVIFHT